eukprot:scaffold6748_cov122-Isochrysis_galbana.AAC.15
MPHARVAATQAGDLDASVLSRPPPLFIVQSCESCMRVVFSSFACLSIFYLRCRFDLEIRMVER